MKTDANDIYREHGDAGFRRAFDEAAAKAKPNGHAQKPDSHRIQLIPFSQIQLGKRRRELVKGLIPREGIAMVWGPPKCGKSFWVFDLMMHVARGTEYRGRRVHQGPVVYCAFEGQSGIEARAEAYRQRFLHGERQDIPFYLQGLTLDLVADHAELIEAIHTQLANQKPVSVVLDTLNRSLRGSESSDEDMAAYVRAADVIRETFKCAVVIIHHCGHDQTRPRGHTSLRGAADVEIAVSRDANDNIVAKVELAKDGAQGDTITGRLEVVDVGFDEDDERISSCVIVQADSPAASKPPVALTQEERGWLKDIEAVFAEPDTAEFASPVSSMAPLWIVTRNVTRDWLKAKGRFVLDGDAKMTPVDRNKLSKMLNRLKDKGKIGITEKHIWLIK